MQASSKKNAPSAQTLVILGTGGTIAGRAGHSADNLGYTAGQIGVADLLAAIPELARYTGGCALEAHQVAQIDSKDMSAAVWRDLLAAVQLHLARPQVRGIVITHGTDTLEETAYFLQSLLAPAKPVVMTCAMRPATSMQADGPQNLCDALAVAAQAQQVVSAAGSPPGVMVLCAGVLHSAQDVQKLYTYRLDAFGSGDAGALGYVEDGQLRWQRHFVEHRPLTQINTTQAAMEFIASGKPWPRVEVLLNYAMASGAIVNALVADGVQGLVVAGTGNGTLHNALEAALLAAQARGVAVLRSTRCAFGQVMVGGSSGQDIRATPLSAVKARIALMLELMVR